jgi:2-hydroxy-3-keto-5-methylthiopentenyl-1-phosphate phosphatase
MPLHFVCDFDGTVTPEDIGAALETRFSVHPPGVRETLLARWSADEIGHREVTEGLCAGLQVGRDEALAFARGHGVDPHFAAFVAEAEAAGEAVMVASEGLDFYILDALERAGLGHLAVAANRARFEGQRVIPEFPHAGRGCGRCGNCKAVHVAAWRETGRTVVFVGDGLSDRCGARAADCVIARGALLDWCRAHGIDARPFVDFRDVAAHARALRAASAASDAAGAGARA